MGEKLEIYTHLSVDNFFLKHKVAIVQRQVGVKFWLIFSQTKLFLSDVVSASLTFFKFDLFSISRHATPSNIHRAAHLSRIYAVSHFSDVSIFLREMISWRLKILLFACSIECWLEYSLECLFPDLKSLKI